MSTKKKLQTTSVPTPAPKGFVAGQIIRYTEPVMENRAIEPVKTVDPAAALLDEAKRIVTGARRAAYGNPEDNFACIAALWNTYLHRRFPHANDGFVEVTAADVASMMILLKTARLAETPDHKDSVVDIAGYAACLARTQKQEAKP